MALINKLKAIADAIRSKTGKSDLMTLDQMPAEIEGIEAGGGGGENLDEVVAEQAELIEELSSTLDAKIGAYEVGYDAALDKRTDLVVTANGEYTPEGESTGFKSVIVAIEPPPSELDALIDDTITEVNSGVTEVKQNAFYFCSKLTSVNFPNATSVGNYAFYTCGSLTSANFPNATNIGNYVFTSCSKLANVNIPNATRIRGNTFQSCGSLVSADFPKVTLIDSYAFNGCSKLTSVNFPNATSVGQLAFGSCKKLESVVFRSATSIASSSFQNCTILEIADFPKATSIGASVFSSCSSLKAVILRSETMCTLSNTNAFSGCYHILGTVNSTYNPNGDKDGYVYVPRALLSDTDETMDYRRATNWSTYSTQFRALEDYTVDGTITGALDPNKI